MTPSHARHLLVLLALWPAAALAEGTLPVSGRVVAVSRICGGGARITDEMIQALPPPQPLVGKQLLVVAGNHIVAGPIAAKITAGKDGKFTTHLPAGTWCFFDAARKVEKTAGREEPITASPSPNIDAACLATERVRCDALVVTPVRDASAVEVAFYERCSQPYNQPCYHGPMPP